MKYSSSAMLLPFFFILVVLDHHFFLVVESKHYYGKTSNPLVPALYIFGDSLVDSGNNNYLQTNGKANYKPYGVDFPNGTATGRFSNGLTTADFIAKWLCLPYVPAYLSLSDNERSKITTGLNYASGAAGILHETATLTIGGVLSLDEQINYFHSTLRTDLPTLFETLEDLSQYLANSIFMINIGASDYLNNYLLPASYNSSKIYTPKKFSEVLLDTLKDVLTNLYNSGARKFVVFDIGPIGCLPAIVMLVNPNPRTQCIEEVNDLVKIFNMGLTNLLQELTSTLKGSTFIRVDYYKETYDPNQNPFKYGYTAGTTPCCVLGGPFNLPCVPNEPPCENRNAHIYFDTFHPTQRAHFEIAKSCFKGSTTCTPVNIRRLVNL
ncbi:hypothetical protein MKW98_000532 [Papaver atlanticum]|uniref:GDSL esterase/lipase n=1 Tax=Papaver atlanticum TaxID=357466 RepID=A0AAD4X7J1_9MAGN|nr:hypothetical protein MKW98_000532 [Papaver atlanticum]